MAQLTAPDALFLAFQTAVAGRYSIDQELGRGGMGVVYLAREVHLDRHVAIKVLPPDLAARPALRERFLREAQLAAKLSHPHIIPIHAVDVTGDFAYYVMTYVDGETLSQRVQARGPLSARDAARLLREVAWALGHAHTQGLVHRDVKPDNILIERESGRAMVGDFGIAAASGENASTVLSGTPEFMSPEQALGRDVDARSDLYALGITAYFALSGRLPFSGDSATAVLAKQVTERAPPLSSLGVVVPRALAQLVEQCLAKDPADRPARADTLAEQLSVSIEQRRELPAVLRAFVKRNGRMDGGGTLLALITALVAAVGISALTGPAVGVVSLLVLLALMPPVFGVMAAKQLLDHGFAQADLLPAFRTEQANAREERSTQHRPLRAVAERILGACTRVAASTTAALAPVALAGTVVPRFADVGAVVIVGGVVSTMLTLAWLGVMQRQRDVDVEFWSAAWSGRVGTFAFNVAQRLRGAKAVQPAMTHRATELSLGMATEQLFESLPAPSRAALRELPTVLQTLQGDAQRLRARYEQLQDALASAESRADADAWQAVQDDRDMVHARLRDAVAAMETLRLGLLRLHAGATSIESLTRKWTMPSRIRTTSHFHRRNPR
jgi:eukaryotic-like serine/threonine-protein kinase